MAWAQHATELSSSVLNSLFGDKKNILELAYSRMCGLESLVIGLEIDYRMETERRRKLLRASPLSKPLPKRAMSMSCFTVSLVEAY